MFRWLKNGKKGKSKTSKDNSENYGFQRSDKSDNQSRDYGFREGKSHNMDSSLHIYDEISEVPEISFSRQFTLLPEETHTGNNIEGPYLVVPILPARRSSVDTSKHDEKPIGSKETASKETEKRERLYSEPWDSLNINCEKHEKILSHPAFRDCGDSYTCSSIRTDSSRTTSTDTGCEYDMSTSTESDVSSEYKELIDKMQNNLVLKHQILKMIKESDKDDSSQSKVSVKSKSKKTSSTSLDSCDFIRSCDVFDNTETESEYSSGFDEVDPNGSIMYQISPQRNVGEVNMVHLSHRAKSGSTKDRTQDDTIKELYLRPKRPNSVHSDSSACSSKRHSLSQPVPMLVPKPTNIYQGKKIGNQRNSNRLLGDLINMNHNIQTLKF